MPASKVIITCAVTGSIHTPSMSPHLPVTAKEIADAAVGAADAGAAIVHLHARNPDDGRPDQSPEAFAPILASIKSRCDAILNLTTGGSPFMSVEERIRPATAFKPEVASLNMGSMNFGLFPMLRRFSEFKHAWEPKMLEDSRDLVFRNSFKDITYALKTLNETGTRYEFECYDTGHLYNLHHFWQEGLVQAPLFVQGVFGLLGGIGAHPDDFAHMRRTAERLFGEHHRWSALGAGRNQMPVAALSAAGGGHIRVGLEDSLWAGRGRINSFVLSCASPFPPGAFCCLGRERVGGVVRSKSYFWLASHPTLAVSWSQDGAVARHEPAGDWWAAVPQKGWLQDPESAALIRAHWLDRVGFARQELVLIGMGMDQEALRARLDACLLTDHRNVLETEALGLLPQPAPQLAMTCQPVAIIEIKIFGASVF